jgi:hypothetical protein
MLTQFNEVLRAFPPNRAIDGVDAQSLAEEVRERFKIEVPPILMDFWTRIGGGYFADRELFVFSDRAISGRDSVITWNSLNFWAKVFPPPKDGGPLFFAETCFGMQLGFRWDNGVPIGYLLDVDTLEAFRVADNLGELFSHVLADRYAFTDPSLLTGTREKLGLLPEGMHYAPIVSPLAGGQLATENYHLETPNVHLRTSIATWEAIRGLSRSAK